MPEPDPVADNEARLAAANLRGGLWMVLSVVAASAMTISARSASAEISSVMIVMMRAIGGFGLVALAMGVRPRLASGLRFSQLSAHVIRGALVAISTQMGFYTITQMPLATATVLFFSAPIFATIMAIPVLGERPGPRRIAAVAAGFIGVLIVLRPGAVPVTWAMASALGSSLCFAIVLLMSRKMANEDGPLATYISSAVMTFLISMPILGTGWEVPFSTWGWVALAILVVSSLARNIADIQAYRLAEASFLAPLTYTRLVFIAIGAYFLFDETPDAASLLGGIVIMAAALYIARRERAKRLEAARIAQTAKR